MSTKQHCETCDATQPANDTGQGRGKWIIAYADPSYGGSKMSNTHADRIAGAYCSTVCLATRIVKVDRQALRDAMINTEPIQENPHDT